LIELLLEGLLQLAFEFLVEYGVRSLAEPWQRRSEANAVLGGVGALIAGAAAGVVANFVWPTRIVRPWSVPGLSLVFSPLISGYVMQRYGQWRAARDGSQSFIATFWGGALFAFGMALVRFLWVNR
jgi:hypothetical protein